MRSATRSIVSARKGKTDELRGRAGNSHGGRLVGALHTGEGESDRGDGGLGAAAFLGGRRAAVRHAVLAAALGVLLALPLASALAPRIGIAVGHAQAAGTVRPMAARTGTTIAAAVTSSGARQAGLWPIG